MAFICTIFQSIVNILRGRYFFQSRNYSTRVKLHDLSSLPSTIPTIVLDLENALLLSSSTFPYFMVVSMEVSVFARAFLLLLLYPLICCMDENVGLQLMAFVSFFGVRKGNFRVGRAILPKHLLEGVGEEVFEVLMKGRRKVCASLMPLEMVEGFLKEYLGVDVVVGRRMKVVNGYYNGFMEEVMINEEMDMKEDMVGIGRASSLQLYPLFSKCKEVYMLDDEKKKKWHPLPKNKYPKPLVFHDGRLAFKPTVSSVLTMFLWLPMGFSLSILRALLFLLLPYKLSLPILSFSGMRLRVSSTTLGKMSPKSRRKQRLYVCNHRTLLDPLYISMALGERSITAVTYSISRLAELLSPIKTIRLARDRDEDRRRMATQLQEGDLIICPEGTTCREAFLLRFSPLFAELEGVIVPVAIKSWVSMFHGTTASGRKWLDPLFFLMNPNPSYEIMFMEKVEVVEASEGKGASRDRIANLVQGRIGMELGYKCTSLTRKDKYLLLAGNHGLI